MTPTGVRASSSVSFSTVPIVRSAPAQIGGYRLRLCVPVANVGVALLATSRPGVATVLHEP
jgi:hypothetical protein